MVNVWKTEKNADKMKKKSKGKRNSFSSVVNLGTIRFTIKRIATQKLVVILHTAKGLIDADVIGGKSDPYAKVYIDIGSDKCIFEKDHEKTKTYNGTLDVTFADHPKDGTFTFELEDWKDFSIVIALWDADLIKSDDYLGGVSIPYEELRRNGLTEGKGFDFFVNLQPQGVNGHPLEISGDRLWRSTEVDLKQQDYAVKKQNLGQITFKVSKMDNDMVSINLLSADSLKNEDLISKSDPYAKVYIYNNFTQRKLTQEGKAKTKTYSSRLKVTFTDGDFSIPIKESDLSRLFVVIEMYDKDLMKDDYLGGVRIPLALLLDYQYHHHRLTVFLQPLYNDKMPLQLDEHNMESENFVRYVEREEAPPLPPQSPPPKKTLSTLKFEMHLEGDNLVGKVIEAKDLIDADKVGGKSDPYAKIYVCNERGQDITTKPIKTKTYDDPRHVTFGNDAAFRFQGISPSASVYLVITLWDKDTFTKDDYLGGVKVPLNTYLAHNLIITMTTILGRGRGSDNQPFRLNDSDILDISERALRVETPLHQYIYLELSTVQDYSTERVTFGIHLQRAENLRNTDRRGKADPYAMVKLLTKEWQKIPEIQKKTKTKTHNGELNPRFEEKFEFLTQRNEFDRVVIEIWDNDFGKDDYMAGVMFKLDWLQINEKYGLKVPLYSDRNNDWPANIRDMMEHIVTRTEIHVSRPAPIVQRPPMIDTVRTMQESNNALVEYISDARMIAQAKDILDNMPRTVELDENVTENKDNRKVGGLVSEMARMVEVKMQEQQSRIQSLRDANLRLGDDKLDRLADMENKLGAIMALVNEKQAIYRTLSETIIARKNTIKMINHKRDYYRAQLRALGDLGNPNETVVWRQRLEAARGRIPDRVSSSVDTSLRNSNVRKSIQVPVKIISGYRDRMMAIIQQRRQEFRSSLPNWSMIMGEYDRLWTVRNDVQNSQARAEALDKVLLSCRRQIEDVRMEINRLNGEMPGYQRQLQSLEMKHGGMIDSRKGDWERMRATIVAQIEKMLRDRMVVADKAARERLEVLIYEKLISFEEGRWRSGSRGPYFAGANGGIKIEKRRSRSTYRSASSTPNSTLERRSFSQDRSRHSSIPSPRDSSMTNFFTNLKDEVFRDERY